MKKLIQLVNNHFKKFPPTIRLFLLRIFVLFIAWKLIYGFLLQPDRVLDGPLTMKVGGDVAWFLRKSFNSSDFQAADRISEKWFEGQLVSSPVSRIEYKGKKIMHIADSCNGLELYILYLGFLLAIPARLKRKLLFGLLGIAVIYLVNMFRCVGLAYLAIYWRDQFDFAHHYVFKVIVYGTIFLLWIGFAEKTFRTDDYQPAT